MTESSSAGQEFAIHFEQDSTPAVPRDKLEAIRALTEEYAHSLRRIEFYESKLKEAKEISRRLSEVQLPELMDSVHLSSFSLQDGSSVEVADVVSGSLPSKDVEKRNAGLEWLRANGHAGLIKSLVAVNLPRGKDKLAQEVADKLKQMGLEVSRKDDVHHSTLAAWAREMLEHGRDFPQDLLGIYVARRATVKPPAKQETKDNAE